MTIENIKIYIYAFILCIVGCKSDDATMTVVIRGDDEFKEEKLDYHDNNCGHQASWNWTRVDSFGYAYLSGKPDKIHVSSPFLTNSSTDPNMSGT